MRLTLKEIAAAVGGRLTKEDLNAAEVTVVSTDSRNIPAGALFVPIAGIRFDGHDFLKEAFDKGAMCAFVHKEIHMDRPMILVKDTGQALLDLSSYYISQVAPKTVAITGSSGKTTTKDILASVLARGFKTHKTVGNFNNHIGLPLTLLNMPEDTEAAVLEMGMNHLGEISILSRTAKPDIAVITNIGVAHLENLGSRAGILRAKLEILEGLKPGGLALFNGDNDMLKGLRFDGPLYKFITRFYGIGPGHWCYGENIVKDGVRGVSFTAHCEGHRFDVRVPVPGTHMVYNALSAVGVGIALGLAPDEIREGIETFTPSGLRLGITTNKMGVTVIDDAYNSNPDSVEAALDVLKEAPGRKIAVLGDMLELGPEGPSMHESSGKGAVKAGIDLVLCAGELSRHFCEGAIQAGGRAEHFADKESIISYLKRELQPGDTVLIKASRGAAFEEISKSLQEV